LSALITKNVWTISPDITIFKIMDLVIKPKWNRKLLLA